ncbi:Putative radical SAM domain protein (modular protein) [uncultured delta proteobacterium]|uniref:Cyclic dehypoxanthine futalosine synthase n=1 Tax=uncultured delta proteobacterium TaxID=34034 RepID=A0A212JLZ6_9DELT|nr:Putative radical SAM domain protein (modular protein) [uncultured delta proteobacterium]
MLDTASFARLGLTAIREKVIAGERLSCEDGLRLFACPDILAVGSLAFLARTKRHGMRAHFVRNRQINYSNVCHTGCRFCAFARRDGEDGAFTLSREEILARVADDGGMPYAEIHVVGGCNPMLPLAWFEETFRAIKKLRPDAVLKGLTVTEIHHLALMEGITDGEAFARLKEAGVAMVTGGGGEIFNPAVRDSICPGKISGGEYLRLAGEAHKAGLMSNCTMLFGHVESHADRVDHLCKLRAQQDASGGYVCFIPLAFQNRNNALADELEAANGFPAAGPEVTLDRLRTIAVSRLLLDNIEHIKAYWVMLGTKTAQAALFFGADDLDGTIEEEHIGRMAGAASGKVLGDGGLTRSALEYMIRESGFEPVNRDALFRDLSAGRSRPRPKGDADETAAAVKKAADGERLSWDDALTLYRHADLFTLGSLARTVREKLHPGPVVTYVADRNINYSNVCVCACRFCAFYRAPDHPEAYVLTKQQLAEKIEETLELGGTQILLQGGHHPHLPLSFYEDMIRWIRDTYPAIHIHAFSPPEIAFFAAEAGLATRDVIARLRAAGLASIPGGGAEVLANRVRTKVSPNKCPADQWLAIMAEAHELGLKTTATMMFGHEETDVERLEHLFRLRGLQDESLEKGKGAFTAFIPWTFQAANTALPHLPPMPAPGYLRLLALSRLVLDNFPNIQSSWVTMGPEIAQLALFFGANDFGSLMIEENVVAAANVRFRMNREAIHRVIAAAGFEPRQRLMDYTLV